MSQASRELQICDEVYTDFGRANKRLTRHKIVDRCEDVNCQSRIMFIVEPRVEKSSGSWICADWFEPATQGRR